MQPHRPGPIGLAGPRHEAVVRAAGQQFDALVMSTPLARHPSLNPPGAHHLLLVHTSTPRAGSTSGHLLRGQPRRFRQEPPWSGRGRDGDYSPPPAQVRTCRITASDMVGHIWRPAVAPLEGRRSVEERHISFVGCSVGSPQFTREIRSCSKPCIGIRDSWFATSLDRRSEERDRFVTHVARSRCREPSELLLVAQRLDVSGTRTITPGEIASTADRWVRHQRRHGHISTARNSHQRLVHVATDWLRFLGRLESPPVMRGTGADLVDEFAVGHAAETRPVAE